MRRKPPIQEENRTALHELRSIIAEQQTITWNEVSRLSKTSLERSASFHGVTFHGVTFHGVTFHGVTFHGVT